MFVPKFDGGSGCSDDDEEQLVCDEDVLSVEEMVDEELEEEVTLVLEFLDNYDVLVEYDILGLTSDILSRYLRSGNFTFFEGNSSEGDDWDFIFPTPSVKDGEDTLNYKRELLKPFIQWAVSLK